MGQNPMLVNYVIDLRSISVLEYFATELLGETYMTKEHSPVPFTLFVTVPFWSGRLSKPRRRTRASIDLA